MAGKRAGVVMAAKNTWILTKAAASSWVDDYAQSMGAALAYYTMLSIAPFLLIVISLAGMIFGVEAARGEIASQLQGVMGGGGGGGSRGGADPARGGEQAGGERGRSSVRPPASARRSDVSLR